jgi:hypothetical protein
MPDISMCKNIRCPSRVTCVRYRAVPNPYRQSYASFDRPAEAKACQDYWPIERSPYDLRQMNEIEKGDDLDDEDDDIGYF